MLHTGQTSATMKVHQAIARALQDNGVTTMFGVMGDANMFMVDSFIRDGGGTFVSASNEAGGATMALGYAFQSDAVGVCSVTHGPAVTNTSTALVEGVKGSIPMMLICGDTAAEDNQHNQNIPQREIIVATGAGFEQLRSPRTVAEDVARALRRARTERRPIALNTPTDFDWADTVYQPVRLTLPDNRPTPSMSEDLENAIGILAQARRPLILVGRGAMSEPAAAAILRLARRIEAPLATTLKAKDVFRGEPFDLGIFGTISTPATVEVIIESDCILAFGAGLNRYTTSHGTFLKGRRVIQVNLEPTEVGKNYTPDVGLVGEPGAVADLMAHWLDEAEIAPSGFTSEDLKGRLAHAPPEQDVSGEGRPGTVDLHRTLAELDRLLPERRLLVTDGGRFMKQAWTTVSGSGRKGFISSVNFGSIGLGLAYAIGASFAAPGRPVVLVTGDGGFMLGGLAEFNTAVRHGVDLTVVVCNDGAYGAEHVKFRGRDMDPSKIFFDWPDFGPVAAALGGEGVTVRSQDDLAQAGEAIRKRSKPLLIDVKLDPEHI